MCKTWQSFGGVAAQCVESHKNLIKHHYKNAEFIHSKKNSSWEMVGVKQQA